MAAQPAAKSAEVGVLIRDDVYRVVVDQIVSGELRPGDRLSERTMAAKLGVSRTPVKEALRRLENEGFVRTLPRRGIVVDSSAQASVEDAVNVRAVLEALAAGLVARGVRNSAQHPAEISDQLSLLIAEMRRLSRLRDPEALWSVNSGFHELIRRLSGNRYVVQLSSPVLAVDAAVRRRALLDLTEMRRGVREHAKIAEAILAGREAAAEVAMRDHILRSGHFVWHERTRGDASGSPQ